MPQQFVVTNAGINCARVVVAIGRPMIRDNIGGRGLKNDRDERPHTRTVAGAVVRTFLNNNAGYRNLGL
eukprot:3497895-Lingulodinium_polyedra.AAC.1